MRNKRVGDNKQKNNNKKNEWNKKRPISLSTIMADTLDISNWILQMELKG